MKMCPDCGERPSPDQRPPKPGKKKDARCRPCVRELKRWRFRERSVA